MPPTSRSRSTPRRTVTGVLTALCLAATLTAGLAGGADAAGTGGGKGGGTGHGRSKAVFATTELISGAGVLSVSGTVPGSRRKVRLQVQTKGAWVTLKSTKAGRDGAFAVATPFTWYGGHRVRVSAPGYAKTKKVGVATPYTPIGDKSSFAFLGGRVAQTARFNPCRTIRYQVNATEVPPYALAAVQSMMSQISAASGIDLKYAGTTSYVPFASRTLPPRKADLVIAWAADAEVPDFARTDGVVGLGGYLRAVRARDSAGRPAIMTTQAGVVLQTESYSQLFTETTESGPNNPPIGRLVLHEVGHALGLAHSPAASEVMYFTAWQPEPDGLVHSHYGPGDLVGLRKLGLAQGCLSPVRRAGRAIAVPAAAPAS